MSQIGRRYFLRRKDRRIFFDNVTRALHIDPEESFGSRPQIEVVETSRHKIFLINGLSLVAESDGDLFPTLFFEDQLSLLPKITVDMGAVQYVCRGADIMAPGIVEIQGEFEEKSLAVILDERHKKPLAIAQSLFSSKTARTLKKGRILRNLTYVGDDIWNVAKAP